MADLTLLDFCFTKNFSGNSDEPDVLNFRCCPKKRPETKMMVKNVNFHNLLFILPSVFTSRIKPALSRIMTTSDFGFDSFL